MTLKLTSNSHVTLIHYVTFEFRSVTIANMCETNTLPPLDLCLTLNIANRTITSILKMLNKKDIYIESQYHYYRTYVERTAC